MRKLLLLILLASTLTISAQQKKNTTAKKNTTTAVKKTTAGKAKGNPKKSSTKSTTKTSIPTTKDIKQLQAEQANLQKQIKEAESLLKTTKKDVKSQLANLSLINGRISAQQQYVNGIQLEVDTLTHNIGILNREIMRLEDELSECKRKYVHGAMYMYRNRLTQNKLSFIFSSKDFQQMYRRLRYSQEYTKYQRAQGHIVQTKEEELKTKKSELETTNVTKQQMLNEGKRQQVILEGQKKERQAVVDQLSKKEKQLRNTIAEQQRKSQQLNARIDRLVQEEIRKAEERRKAEEAKRKAEEERRQREQAARENNTKKNTGSKTTNNTRTGGSNKSSSSSSNTSSTHFNAPDNADRQLSSNFAANQGRLPVPITGSYIITAHYGTYSPEGLTGVTLDNKGTDYTGKLGAQARCIFDGIVTSVFSLGGTTNVLVRHGSYISVYCNLSSANVRQGQKVSARQNLGPVARDASGNVTLHFQLRKETAKLNPERWIGR